MLGWLMGKARGRAGATLLEDARRHQEAGRLLEAEAACRAAIAASADDAQAHSRLGSVLRDQGRLGEAVPCYLRALALRPDDPRLHIDAGILLNDVGRPSDASAHFLAAIERKPDSADAHANLGNSLQYLNRLDEAVACYRKAIALDAGYVEAHHNLGNALSGLDRPEEAAASFRQALALAPDFIESRWALTISQLPAVCMDRDEAARRRAAFAGELKALAAWFDATRTALGVRAVGINQPFYLAYQEENNRDLLADYGALCARLMAHWGARRNLRAPTRRAPTAPVRVGIVSEYFWNHSVWNAIVRGWFEQIDPRRIALHGFYLGAVQDEETRFARSRAARFVEGSRSLGQWAQAILDDALDVLIYPNIGNDPVALKLASLRLAPVQVTSWGHPETTGLPTLDYYLSAQGMEPEGADDNYVERLVALPNLGCFYRPHAVTPVPVSAKDLGIDADVPLLLCAGTPFKYAPQHDALLVDIARRVGRCRFLFFVNANCAPAAMKLRQRLHVAFATAGLRADEFVAFLPWLDRPRYYGLMQRAHALLDTIGFSGFNVAMQAVECGLPVVAWQGRFLRGRFASAILQRMGLPELVARSGEEYAAIAARLLSDDAFRVDTRARIAARRALLFEDTAPVRALEDFLAAAAARAPQEERSP